QFGGHFCPSVHQIFGVFVDGGCLEQLGHVGRHSLTFGKQLRQRLVHVHIVALDPATMLLEFRNLVAIESCLVVQGAHQKQWNSANRGLNFSLVILFAMHATGPLRTLLPDENLISVALDQYSRSFGLMLRLIARVLVCEWNNHCSSQQGELVESVFGLLDIHLQTVSLSSSWIRFAYRFWSM